MPPRPRLTQQDHVTWAAFTQSVQPLPGRPGPSAAPAPAAGRGAPAAPATVPQPAATLPPASQPAPARSRRDLVTGEAPAGLDRSSWNRFRTGRIATVRTLDLHGKTVHAAYLALQRFLLAAHADQIRCVEIITGRGSGETGGAIRRELPHWLNQAPLRPLILAASHPHAANPGSTRLLLRKLGKG